MSVNSDLTLRLYNQPLRVQRSFSGCFPEGGVDADELYLIALAIGEDPAAMFMELHRELKLPAENIT